MIIDQEPIIAKIGPIPHTARRSGAALVRPPMENMTIFIV